MARPKIPPFKRDSVDVGRHGRAWKDDVPVTDLKPGDSILGSGMIFSVENGVGLGDQEYVMFLMHSGDCFGYNADKAVTAFIVDSKE